MNLWKLWIAGKLLSQPCRCRRKTHRGGMRRCGRDSMNHMDEVHVAQAEIGEVPPTFEGRAVLLDVREDDEWQRGHAPGAQHIPMGQIPTRLNEIDPNADLFVVCQAGGRSQRVARYLAGNGYAPVNVVGGMLAWAGAGRPVVTDSGDAGVV
jgi:rhodanese-related sulfurtransferase